MRTNEASITHNARRLSEWIMQDLPPDVGFALIVFPKDSEGKAACLSNCRKERLARELQQAHEKLSDRLIHMASARR